MHRNFQKFKCRRGSSVNFWGAPAPPSTPGRAIPAHFQLKLEYYLRHLHPCMKIPREVFKLSNLGGTRWTATESSKFLKKIPYSLKYLDPFMLVSLHYFHRIPCFLIRNRQHHCTDNAVFVDFRRACHLGLRPRP